MHANIPALDLFILGRARTAYESGVLIHRNNESGIGSDIREA